MEQLQFLFGVLLIILVTNYRALCLPNVGSEKHDSRKIVVHEVC